ncbi:O-antigen ligase family protein [Halalkalicoccus tibetensis]|uniref:O-antigen ligase family protein n=1 Tax=Halalkalicoccus tibetensis TaxID=175632 RepID=A0ABD5V980_9EURY
MSYVRSQLPDRIPWVDAWLPFLCIVAALATNTWLVSPTVGYVVSVSVLAATGAYVVFVSDVEIRIDVLFAVLFGGYWLLLAAGWLVDGSSARLLYVAITPLSVVVAVFLLPAVVDRYRGEFIAGLTALGVAIATIGFGMLLAERILEMSIHWWTGGFVYGVPGYRTNSVFANPNTYGFLMMVCTISAVAHVANRGPGLAGIGAIALCGAAVVTSDSTAALMGTGFGLAVFVAAIRRRLAIALFVVGALAVVGLIAGVYTGLLSDLPFLGRIEALVGSLLAVRVVLWQASIERLLVNPLVGIGFADTAAEIRPYVPDDGPVGFGTHNSYIHILLQTGLVAGSLYLLAVFYAGAKATYSALLADYRPAPATGGIGRWWPIYVLATLAAILVALVFESMTIGGLSLDSVLVGLYLGLALSLSGSWLVRLRADHAARSIR